MKIRTKYKIFKTILLATKIGVGASIAIYVAEFFELQFATSAGSIAILTLITTKWGTLKLSLQRICTYVASVGVCWFTFQFIPSLWIEYGIFLFFIVLLTEWLGWRSTLSVNAVIGAHFLTTQDFSLEFFLNELSIVLIGITIAIVLNLVHINNEQETGIISAMRHVEKQMKQILVELAGYLSMERLGESVWEDLTKLEKDLEEYLELACEYQNNTFQSHPGYYINYFEMRMKQCGALHNLNSEMKRMRHMPKQARIVAAYISNMVPYVTEMNTPEKQIEELEDILESLREEPLPQTHEEFLARAELYHVLLDIEEFILYKKRFVEEIDEVQFRVYWKKEIEKN